MPCFPTIFAVLNSNAAAEVIGGTGDGDGDVLFGGGGLTGGDFAEVGSGLVVDGDGEFAAFGGAFAEHIIDRHGNIEALDSIICELPGVAGKDFIPDLVDKGVSFNTAGCSSGELEVVTGGLLGSSDSQHHLLIFFAFVDDDLGNRPDIVSIDSNIIVSTVDNDLILILILISHDVGTVDGQLFSGQTCTGDQLNAAGVRKLDICDIDSTVTTPCFHTGDVIPLERETAFFNRDGIIITGKVDLGIITQHGCIKAHIAVESSHLNGIAAGNRESPFDNLTSSGVFL